MKPAKYDPKKIEVKWQKYWLSKKTFVAPNKSKSPKKFVLVEFPYPSGAGLHMGHMRPFVAGDVVSKYYRLQGFNVMYPMGWDAFGLPAENYAIKNKVHPSVSTAKNVANAKKQLLSWGTGYDWSREVNTTDPDYYKWTQKLFLEFFKAGLAYEKFGEINWCPKDKTGLANEEVVDGKCERCGTEVEKKNLRQWYLKITEYAQKLLDGLNDLPDWPDSVKQQQANWIGRSEGVNIINKVKDLDITYEVYDSIPQTIYAQTYSIIAPEHPLVLELVKGTEKEKEVMDFVAYIKDKKAKKKFNIETDLEGVFTGRYIENFLNTGRDLPIWVASYALYEYGTGAVNCSAHDERDFAFAKKFDIPLLEVLAPHVVDTINPPDPAKKTVRRKNVHCVVEDEDGTHLIGLKWKGYDWQSFVIGGVEEGEAIIDAGRREVIEETGYTDFEFVRTLGGEIHSEYYAAHKDINRYAEVIGLVFRLKSKTKKELTTEEAAKHEVVWIKQEEAEQFYWGADMKLLLERYRGIEKPIVKTGILLEPSQFAGRKWAEVRNDMINFLVENGFAKRKVNFKMRDWVFSRQRYWGEPIPLIHCPKCGIVPVPEKDLPVKLPNVRKYEPTGTGESPLAAIESWVNTPCPKCIEDSKKTKYLVFDFDGVLGDTSEVNIQSRIDMGWVKTREESIQRQFDYFTKKPVHSKGHAMSKEEESALLKEFIRFGGFVKGYSFELFADFIKEIKKIKNTKIAIISSGSKVYVADGVKRTGLKIESLQTCEDSLSKEEKLEYLAKKWKVGVEDLYYFTDASCDVYELENLMDRKKIIGCSWGYVGFDELRKALPENQILKKSKDIHNVLKPQIGRRETNTMPQWAGSSWYWLRYMDPKNKKEFAALSTQKYWSPVDLYFGGMEHTTLHLLYSRFWNLVFKDRGLVTVSEPYKKRVPHGIILGPDGEKMSKSRGNVVNPDELVKLYGADTVRLYMMFLGPHGAQVSWNDKGIVGARRFIERVFGLVNIVSAKEDIDVTKLLHKTIKKVEEDLETFSFNTAVSALMIFVNKVIEKGAITKSSLEKFLTILSPLVPHTAEEMWANLKYKGSIFVSKWPKFDSKLIIDTEVTIVVQVNGKLRGQIKAETSANEESVLLLAKAEPKVMEFLGDAEIKKTIFIKDKLVNFVI